MSKIYKGHTSKITSTPCSKLTLYNWRITEECPMAVKCQAMDAVYDCRVNSSELPKSHLGYWQKKNGSKDFITTKSHSATNDILISS